MMVGVAKALPARAWSRTGAESAMRLMAMNCKPMSAPADEPTMTLKFSQPANGLKRPPHALSSSRAAGSCRLFYCAQASCARVVLLVAHLFHPLHHLAVLLLLDGDVRHCSCRRGAVPV